MFEEKNDSPIQLELSQDSMGQLVRLHWRQPLRA